MGIMKFIAQEVPSWNNIDCKWVDSKQLIRLCVTFKDGKIFNTGPTCYNASQKFLVHTIIVVILILHLLGKVQVQMIQEVLL